MPVTFSEFQRLTNTSLWGQEHCPAEEVTETSNLSARCRCRNLYRASLLFVHLALPPATCISQLERPRTLLLLGKKENCPKGESTKGLPLLQEIGTANSLAELSTSAELGLSKVSAVGQT